jgi:hypothetical protein
MRVRIEKNGDDHVYRCGADEILSVNKKRVKLQAGEPCICDVEWTTTSIDEVYIGAVVVTYCMTFAKPSIEIDIEKGISVVAPLVALKKLV